MRNTTTALTKHLICQFIRYGTKSRQQKKKTDIFYFVEICLLKFSVPRDIST